MNRPREGLEDDPQARPPPTVHRSPHTAAATEHRHHHRYRHLALNRSDRDGRSDLCQATRVEARRIETPDDGAGPQQQISARKIARWRRGAQYR